MAEQSPNKPHRNAQIARSLSMTFINKLRGQKEFNGLNGAEPPGIYKDTHHASMGLMLRLNPAGTMTFFVKGKINDRAQKKSFTTFRIGDARIMTLEDARQRAAEYSKLLQKGLNPIDNIDGLGKPYVTLSSLLDEYISRNTELKENTKKKYRYSLNCFSKKITDIRIEQLTYSMLQQEHRRVGNDKPYIADQTIKLIESLISFAQINYIDKATDEPIVKNNPARSFHYNKDWLVNNGKARRKQECIDTEDLPCLLNALDQLEEYRDGIKYKHQTPLNSIIASHFFKFLLFTGWRPEEVVKIKWSQIGKDFKDVTWDDSEAAASLKNAESQYRCPLNSYASSILGNLHKLAFKSEYVFPNSSLNGHFKQNPSDYIDALAEIMNNNKRYTSGIYRKTFQTYAEQCNIISTTIKRLVFHTQKVYDVQSGYIKLQREALRKHSQKIGDFIMYNAGRIDAMPFVQDDTSIQVKEVIQQYIEIAANKAAQSGKTIEDYLQLWLKLGMHLDNASSDEKMTVKQFLATI